MVAGATSRRVTSRTEKIVDREETELGRLECAEEGADGTATGVIQRMLEGFDAVRSRTTVGTLEVGTAIGEVADDGGGALKRFEPGGLIVDASDMMDAVGEG